MKPVEPIAIIGIGCRMPGGAGGPDDMWNLLLTASMLSSV
jgi:acyl transferase domain-containing protein